MFNGYIHKGQGCITKQEATLLYDACIMSQLTNFVRELYDMNHVIINHDWLSIRKGLNLIEVSKELDKLQSLSSVNPLPEILEDTRNEMLDALDFSGVQRKVRYRSRLDILKAKTKSNYSKEL